jgi:Tic22-like family
MERNVVQLISDRNDLCKTESRISCSHFSFAFFTFFRSDATADVPVASDGTGKKYPALSKQEIEEWLEHIPVFAVTDSNGAGVVLKPENDTSVFYFFLNPMQANATLQQLMSGNEEMDLKVSAFSLGKIWFNLLNADTDKEVLLKSPGAEDEVGESVKGVEYRLVPDTRDLLGARMLLTMTPEDGEKLKEGGSMTPEVAQAAIKKAMTESPKFKMTFNEIPVFTIAQMRMQKQATADGEEAVTLLPMYFSLQNMVGTWQQFMSQATPDIQGVEPAINLMSLHDLVDMMSKESEIDWRHVVLVPPTADTSSSSGGGTTVQAADPMAQMGGATLGDELGDDDV